MEKPTNEHLDTMFEFIKNKMQYDTWYPIKSDLAHETIMMLFGEGIIQECELDKLENNIRRINLDNFKSGNNDSKRNSR
jgi:hypothetical protein